LFGVNDGAAVGNLSHFFTEVSKKLGIEPTIFNLTDDDNIILVTVPRFWLQTYTHRQLFTILLRSGVSFVGDFNKALLSDPYAANTKRAVQKFFDGYTKISRQHSTCVYNGGGWADFFTGAYGDDDSKFKTNTSRLEILTK
jgi:hypothetical protein